MGRHLTRLKVRNYRALADLDLELGPLMVFFGPNGSGKSTILDVLVFLRDCDTVGTEASVLARGGAAGLVSVGAAPGAALEVGVETAELSYRTKFGITDRGLHRWPGELLVRLADNFALVEREPTTNRITLNDPARDTALHAAPEMERLSLALYNALTSGRVLAAVTIAGLLTGIRLYAARSFDLAEVTRRGSAGGTDLKLTAGGSNLWTVLRNWEGRRSIEPCYETISCYTRRAFPFLRGTLIEATSPTTLYGSFVEDGLAGPLPASLASDGHIHFLMLMTALFAPGPDTPAILLFDEPETSLHPWAISVFAEAVQEAVEKWNRQVLIATHSPVLISQFEPASCYVTSKSDRGTGISRVSEMEDAQPWLEDYAAGSLYMAELLARQSVAEPQR